MNRRAGIRGSGKEGVKCTFILTEEHREVVDEIKWKIPRATRAKLSASEIVRAAIEHTKLLDIQYDTIKDEKDNGNYQPYRGANQPYAIRRTFSSLFHLFWYIRRTFSSAYNKLHAINLQQ